MCCNLGRQKKPESEHGLSKSGQGKKTESGLGRAIIWSELCPDSGLESAQNLVGFLQESVGKVIGSWHGVRYKSAGNCEEADRNLAEVC